MSEATNPSLMIMPFPGGGLRALVHLPASADANSSLDEVFLEGDVSTLQADRVNLIQVFNLEHLNDENPSSYFRLPNQGKQASLAIVKRAGLEIETGD